MSTMTQRGHALCQSADALYRACIRLTDIKQSTRLDPRRGGTRSHNEDTHVHVSIHPLCAFVKRTLTAINTKNNITRKKTSQFIHRARIHSLRDSLPIETTNSVTVLHKDTKPLRSFTHSYLESWPTAFENLSSSRRKSIVLQHACVRIYLALFLVVGHTYASPWRSLACSITLRRRENVSFKSVLELLSTWRVLASKRSPLRFFLLWKSEHRSRAWSERGKRAR